MAGDFRVTRQYIYIAGNIIDPLQNNTNEGVLYADINAMMNNVTGHQHTGIPGDAPPISGGSFIYPLHFTGLVTFDNAPQLAPIGSVIPFYDFGTIGNPPPGLLTFNSTYWAYCNGQTATVGSIGVRTLPDMSGRVAVGFGTDGGGAVPATSNGGANWAVVAVGNAGNTINIQHSHTVNSHTHGLANHTHVTGDHTHGAGSYTAALHNHGVAGDTGNIVQAAPGTGGEFNLAAARDLALDFTSPLQGDHIHTLGSLVTSGTAPAVTGTSAAGGAGATTTGPTPNTSDATAPGTDNQLSTTQSIQPISIRFRYIMRIL